MSGLWGYQSALDLFLQEHGITTLLFAGVNADQVRILSSLNYETLILLIQSTVRRGDAHRRVLQRVRLPPCRGRHSDLLSNGWLGERGVQRRQLLRVCYRLGTTGGVEVKFGNRQRMCTELCSVHLMLISTRICPSKTETCAFGWRVVQLGPKRISFIPVWPRTCGIMSSLETWISPACRSIVQIGADGPTIPWRGHETRQRTFCRRCVIDALTRLTHMSTVERIWCRLEIARGCSKVPDKKTLYRVCGSKRVETHR